jgi:hypothetical protein
MTKYTGLIRFVTIKYFTRGKMNRVYFLINFHPEGEPEAPICYVIQGLQ